MNYHIILIFCADERSCSYLFAWSASAHILSKSNPNWNMEKEDHAFYVVRKGDIVSIYRSLSDCQAQVSPSVIPNYSCHFFFFFISLDFALICTARCFRFYKPVLLHFPLLWSINLVSVLFDKYLVHKQSSTIPISPQPTHAHTPNHPPLSLSLPPFYLFFP